MPDGDDAIAVEVCERIDRIPAEEWDACAAGAPPFLSHAFLHALEASGSATAETGWLPRHLAIRDGSGRLVGCAPLYLKGHSYGEYVFDWAWAQAYERAGGDYYPKLQCCVPFTPVTGPRFLTHPESDRETVRRGLIAGMAELTRRHEVSSLHVTFPTEEEWQLLGEFGFLQRIGVQYHWENRGYGSFDDFLGALASRKRKQIRKERRAAQESGLVIRALSGPEIEPRHWDAFYRFYLSTSDRKWGQAYLTREFFERIAASLADRVVLVVAEEEGGKPVAGALNLRDEHCIYGRNWGCLDRVKFLHFELCYYQAIDYAIAHGLERVEAGAQGEHKIQRGYQPRATYSAHFIADPGLGRAVAQFLEQERRALTSEMAYLEDFGPFKKGQDSGQEGPDKP